MNYDEFSIMIKSLAAQIDSNHVEMLKNDQIKNVLDELGIIEFLNNKNYDKNTAANLIYEKWKERDIDFIGIIPIELNL